ncbi:hypothetical protein AGR8A_Cc60259 [Agrobacterium fabrum str. J-07]|nr:hypothetical protein AGR8A_Cc60259 [Agrobacterium fabrum str. J-07]
MRTRQEIDKQAKLALITNTDHIGGFQLQIGGYPLKPGGRKQCPPCHRQKTGRIRGVVSSLGNLDPGLRHITAKTGIDEQQRNGSAGERCRRDAACRQQPQTMSAPLRYRHRDIIPLGADRDHIRIFINHLKPSAAIGAARNGRLSKPYERLKDRGKQMVNTPLRGMISALAERDVPGFGTKAVEPAHMQLAENIRHAGHF